jgi:hypothetical protein
MERRLYLRLETRSSQTKGGSVSGSSSDNYSSSVDVVRWAQVGGAGRGGLVGSCGCRVTEPCLAR